MSYENMSVVNEEEEEELLETDVETEPAEQSPKEEKPTSDETQLYGMITLVWVLVIISLIVFTASTVIKHKRESKTKVEYVEVASNMYSLDTIQTEEDSWTDYITVTKKVQTNDSTIAFYLTGKAENYKKTISIPVTQEQFATVRDGDRVQFVFSRLSLEGKEFILIRGWSECGVK